QVRGVVLPAHDGLVGILTGRAPMLVKLGTGELRAEVTSGTSRQFSISGGVAQMKDNKLVVLTEQATEATV
ncbi:MAG: F0F1 ATP synthase subunit epsilon, partial [Planctomycetota bacterium]